MDALDSPRRWSVVCRTAALHAWLVGLGFGLPCVYAIWYFADQGLVWTFMGSPTYGEAGIGSCFPGSCTRGLLLTVVDGFVLSGRDVAAPAEA
jgi:hypothetical protein